jgi:predicted NodU family carbamoyl transferase
VGLRDIDRVVFYDKPFVKFERLLETYLTCSPRGFTSFRMALPLWLREKLFQKSLLADELKATDPEFDWQTRLLFCEHHLSHAASAQLRAAQGRAGSRAQDRLQGRLRAGLEHFQRRTFWLRKPWHRN